MIKTKKLVCVLTMARDEKKLFPIWENYYGSLFGFENLFVINNHTIDGSLDESKSKIINFDNKIGYDEYSRNEMINKTQIKLLNEYKYVIFSDVDEIIIPNSNFYKNLFYYIKFCKKERIACNGYELIHRSFETKIDQSISIFKQRSYWTKSKLYDKPCIVAKKTNWNLGLHTCKEKFFFDENLYLIHLRRYDIDFCLERQMWKFNLEIKNIQQYDINHSINRIYKISKLSQKEKTKTALNFCNCENLKFEKIPNWLTKIEI